MTRTLAALLAFISTPCFAQQTAQPQSTGRTMTLNVVVSSHKGDRVEGLTASDFTLLDNKTPRPVTTLKAVTATAEQARAIIVIDAVNTAYTRVAFERGQVTKFLKANGGRLARPTTIAVLTDKGAQIQKGFSTDGNALSAALAQAEIGLRTIRRSSGIWGANERVGISLTALHELKPHCMNSSAIAELCLDERSCCGSRRVGHFSQDRTSTLGIGSNRKCSTMW